MEPVKIIQPSFSSGELSPALGGRVDLAKYRTGASVMENFMVQPQGGAINRPGFQYIASLPEPCWAIPFQFSIYQSYTLWFGNNTMYVIKNGGQVLSGGNPLVVTTPYGYPDVKTLKFKQNADTMFLAHPSYPPYMLQRFSDTDWVFTPLTFSVATLPPTGLAGVDKNGTGSVTQQIQYQVSTVGQNSEESLPSVPITVTVHYPWSNSETVALSWNAVAGASQYKVYKNNLGYFGTIAVLSAVTAKVPNGTAISGGDFVGQPAANAFDGDLTTFWVAGQTGAAAIGVAYIGQNFSTPWMVTGVRINLGTAGNFSDPPTQFTLQSSPDGSTWTNQMVCNYVPAANLWYPFTLPTGVSAQYWRLLLTDPVTTRNRWNVAEVEIQSNVPPTTFIDDNIDPDVTDGPQTTTNPFQGTDNYPGAVGLYQQRLFLAGTNNNPQTIWGTETGLYFNMGLSFPLKATDSIEVAIASGQVDQIKHMLPLNNLLLFTSGSEWVMGPGQNTDGITPTSVVISPQGYRGCTDVPPIAIGRQVLFVQRNGTVVREMDYSSYFSLFTNLFAPTIDVSLFSNHLFDGYSLQQWAYQQTPYYIVWAVRSDGVLLGFTYIKDQQIAGWHRHDTQGQFLSCATVDEGAGQTELYVMTQRTVGGAAVYFIERMFHRIPVANAVFLDAALTYNGTPQTVFSGLDYLDGCTVGIVADGSVLEPQVVVSGSVTLATAASVVAVGLPYTANLMTMKLEQEMQGTIQGRLGVVPRLIVRLQDTIGGWIGPNLTDLVQLPPAVPTNWNQAPQLFTGDLINPITPEWTRGIQVAVQQPDPLPISVLAVIPEVEVSET